MGICNKQLEKVPGRGTSKAEKKAKDADWEMPIFCKAEDSERRQCWNKRLCRFLSTSCCNLPAAAPQYLYP